MNEQMPGTVIFAVLPFDPEKGRPKRCTWLGCRARPVFTILFRAENRAGAQDVCPFHAFCATLASLEEARL